MTHVTVEYSLMNIVTDGNFIGSNDVKPVLCLGVEARTYPRGLRLSFPSTKGEGKP
jgi:hypothetical protein